VSQNTTDGRSPEGVKVLSELEIQKKLYGIYRDTKKSEVSSSPEWTGSEILAGELNRLRSELVSLRKEKESLVSQLEEHASPEESGAFRWVGRWMVVFLLLGLVGYFGVKKLQASPVPLGEPMPYTVQVAVYDIRPMAEETVEFLNHLQYQAFLVEMPRQDGRMQYRVYMGSFVTKSEADLERMRLAGDPRFRDFKDAFVRYR
jgi:hypothetical protein